MDKKSNRTSSKLVELEIEIEEKIIIESALVVNIIHVEKMLETYKSLSLPIETILREEKELERLKAVLKKMRS